jgi:hypothetical protein
VAQICAEEQAGGIVPVSRCAPPEFANLERQPARPPRDTGSGRSHVTGCERTRLQAPRYCNRKPQDKLQNHGSLVSANPTGSRATDGTGPDHGLTHERRLHCSGLESPIVPLSSVHDLALQSRGFVVGTSTSLFLPPGLSNLASEPADASDRSHNNAAVPSLLLKRPRARPTDRIPHLTSWCSPSASFAYSSQKTGRSIDTAPPSMAC